MQLDNWTTGQFIGRSWWVRFYEHVILFFYIQKYWGMGGGGVREEQGGERGGEKGV